MNRETLVLSVAIFAFILLFLICMIRAIKGPRIADRMMAVNVGTTIITVIIAIVAVLLNEGYYVDIAIIYVLLSFMAVVVFVRVYLGIYRKHKAEEEKHE